MWKYYALLSAFFASLTAIFAKIGVKDVNSDLATAIQFLSRRLWKPFHKTLDAIEAFRLESGTCPQLGDRNIIELNRLNRALERMMHGSLRSYQAQKEFTENASHELQTPLAVFQSKLDILLQQPGITEGQAAIQGGVRLLTLRFGANYNGVWPHRFRSLAFEQPQVFLFYEQYAPPAAHVLGSGVVGEVFYGAVEINVHAMSLRGLSEQRK